MLPKSFVTGDVDDCPLLRGMATCDGFDPLLFAEKTTFSSIQLTISIQILDNIIIVPFLKQTRYYGGFRGFCRGRQGS